MRNSTRIGYALCVVLASVLVPGLHPTVRADEEGAEVSSESERDESLLRADRLRPNIIPMYKEGRHAEAIELAREVLRLRETASTRENVQIAQALIDLAPLLEGQGEYREARSHLERAIELLVGELGEDHQDLAVLRNWLATLMMRTGAYREAIPVAERALKSREEVLGRKHADVADTLNMLGLLHRKLAKFDKARAYFDEALSIREDALGAEHRDVAQSLNNLGSLCWATGKYEQAKPYFERALAIKRRVLGPEHAEIAVGLLNLGAVRESLGNYKEARRDLEKAVEVIEKARSPQHPEIAPYLNNLAGILRKMGYLHEAESLYRRALRLRESALGDSHPDVAQAVGNVAIVLRDLGEQASARRLEERALAIRERALGPQHPDVAVSLQNLSASLQAAGQLDQAYPLLKRALRIKEDALGESHPEVGMALANLGVLVELMRDHSSAQEHYRKALGIFEGALGDEHPLVAHCLSSLAGLQLAAEDWCTAVPLCQRSLEIRVNTLGSGHPRVAESLSRLARALEGMGEVEKAEAHGKRAVEIIESALGSEHPHLASALLKQGDFLARQGDFLGARPYVLRSLSIMERHTTRCLGGLSRQERISLTGRVRVHLDAWQRVAHPLGLSGYDEALRLKGLVTRTLATERWLARHAGAEALKLAEEQLATSRQLSSLANRIPPVARVNLYRRWSEAYATTKAEHERIRRKLELALEPYRDALRRLSPRVADIQAALPRGKVLVDVLRTNDRYVAWIVSQRRSVARIDLGMADLIDEAVYRFGDLCADPESSPGSTEYTRLAAALSDLLVKPVVAHLPQDTSTVLVSPDSAIASLPLAALPSEPGRVLLDEDVAILHIAMAQDLLQIREPSLVGRGALLIGGVDYGLRGAERRGTEPVEARGSPRSSDAGHRHEFPPLPATLAEVRGVGANIADESRIIEGASATESALRELASGLRIVHLATHGFVRLRQMERRPRLPAGGEWLGSSAERLLAEQYDPMLLTGLAMAGANVGNDGSEDDGILTALEVSYLDLETIDLAVLSACETARGKEEAGEGTVGLVQAFHTAGAKQVIGSLWKVDDETSHALMVKFYELWSPKREVEGMSATDALAAAQDYIRTHPEHPEWKHPYYWAAWVLWGLPD